MIGRRPLRLRRGARATAPQALGDERASKAAYVDAALAQQRRGDAEAMLGLEAGWGLAAGAWAVEAALQPWRAGSALSEVVSGVEFRVVERGGGVCAGRRRLRSSPAMSRFGSRSPPPETRDVVSPPRRLRCC